MGPFFRATPYISPQGTEFSANESVIKQGTHNKSQIVNLFDHLLTPTEMNILCKGLSFVPTPKFNNFNWTKDMCLFARKLRWQKYFCLKQKREAAELGIDPRRLEDVRLLFGIAESTVNTGKGPMTTFKNSSIKMPPQGDISAVDVFVDVLLRDLEHMRIHSRPNCTQTELEAIQPLEQDENVVLKPSDKGGNIVLMNRDQYLLMCNALLNDVTCYETLPRDPTAQYQGQLREILETAKRN